MSQGGSGLVRRSGSSLQRPCGGGWCGLDRSIGVAPGVGRQLPEDAARAGL